MSFIDYTNVRTAIFVRIEVPEYFVLDKFVSKVLTFSDHYTDFTINGEVYTALGNLVSVEKTKSELKTSSDTVSIAISAIPNSSLKEIMRSRFKNSTVKIYRAFFNSAAANNTNELIEYEGFVNPIGRYAGFVNNYAIEEQWDAVSRTSTNTIIFSCASTLDILARKKAGRRTNPASMKRFFPTDVSFDRVPALVNAAYDFGDTQ